MPALCFAPVAALSRRRGRHHLPTRERNMFGRSCKNTGEEDGLKYQGRRQIWRAR